VSLAFVASRSASVDADLITSQSAILGQSPNHTVEVLHTTPTFVIHRTSICPINCLHRCLLLPSARGCALSTKPDVAVSSATADPDALRIERHAAFREGVLAVMPALLATSIWGLVTGVAMAKSGLTESMALTMTLLVYAGSAQLTALPLIVSAAPLWLVFAAGLVVNLRFLIFSAALHPYFRTLSWPRRLALGYFTTDISFVLFIPRFGDAKVRGTLEQRWFFLGTIVPAWLVWQGSSIVGIFLGAVVPAGWSLDFAAVLALMAIVLPLIKTRPVLVSAIAAGVAAWIGQPLPLRLGLAGAVIVGVAAGMWAEWRENKRKGR